MYRFRKIYHILRLFCILGGGKSVARYIKKHKIYGCIGDNCSIQTRRLPVYPNLVFLHDNVIIATDVRFVVHDAVSFMLNKKYNDFHFVERVGCIEIMNNVFVGAGTRILYNVRIGNNVIIGAGSLINKDVPNNSVYAGVPAKYICSFDEYVRKARERIIIWKQNFGKTFKLSEEICQQLYNEFCNIRKNDIS